MAIGKAVLTAAVVAPALIAVDAEPASAGGTDAHVCDGMHWGIGCNLNKRGSAGYQTVAIQTVLKTMNMTNSSRYVDPGTIDGHYGPMTENAVANFQFKQGGMESDGVVGVKTWGEYMGVNGDGDEGGLQGKLQSEGSDQTRCKPSNGHIDAYKMNNRGTVTAMGFAQRRLPNLDNGNDDRWTMIDSRRSGYGDCVYMTVTL